jgi:hypothetical protein
MALRDIKEKVLKMRLSGMSYSQIRAVVKVSKSTLSLWLKDMSLSPERIRELRDFSAVRIEKCRNTKAKKKQDRLATVFKKVSIDIGKLSDREIFLCGLFLYWGEGTKTSESVTALTNTNPSMIKFFINWYGVLGVEKSRLKFRLQLYADMDIQEETLFWASSLDIPLVQFSKPHMKKSNLIDRTYKVGFGHGTCTVSFNNNEMYMYVKSALLFMQNLGK